jgi:serine/threonine-protein kinase RsbW
VYPLMAHDQITLTVPAKSEYARTVRMTAAALVGRTSMSYDDVEDVRMAAEEAFVYAVDTLPEDSEVRFTFTVDDDSIGIDVLLGSEKIPSDDADERATAYAGFILEAVCDSHEFTSDDTGAHLHLLKRAGSGDAS